MNEDVWEQSKQIVDESVMQSLSEAENEQLQEIM